jgi:hypothetical protein
MSITREGRGYLRNQQESTPATKEARTIKRNSAGNPQVATGVPAHDDRSGADKAASATRRLEPSSHGATAPITGGPPSARAPRKAK